MKNIRLRKTHPLVLAVAVILTVFSIVGSVALADLPPLAYFLAKQPGNSPSSSSHSSKNSTQSQQESVVPDKSRKNTSFLDNAVMAKVDYANKKFNSKTFNSVVKPKLTSCFNCGVIVAIETVNNDSGRSTATADNESLFEHQLDNYLDAHRKNARLITLTEDRKHLNAANTGEVESNSTTYVIKVRMQNGSQHVVMQNTAPTQSVGAKVRLITERSITA